MRVNKGTFTSGPTIVNRNDHHNIYMTRAGVRWNVKVKVLGAFGSKVMAEVLSVEGYTDYCDDPLTTGWVEIGEIVHLSDALLHGWHVNLF